MAVHALRKVQFGNEVTWDTAVAATAKLMAVNDGSINYSRTVYKPDFLGSLAPANTADLVATEWSGTISGAVTYEDLPYFLDGLYGEASATASSPWIYDYDGPDSAVPTSPRLFTIEYGTSDGSYKASGGLVSELKITIEQGQAWMYEASFIGASLATVSLASLSDRSVTLVNTADTSLYIDPVGSIGSTTIASTLVSAELTLTTGRHLKRFVGDTAPSNWGEGKHGGELKLVMELNATSKAYFDAALAASLEKAIQIKGVSGTNTATIGFYGTLDGETELFGDRDGNSIIEYTFGGYYYTSGTTWLDVTVENAVSALP